LVKVGPEQSGPHLRKDFEMRQTMKLFARARERMKIRAAKRRLLTLDDRMLRDIGVPRDEIDYVVKAGLRRTQHFDF
jgi:uncharacterized protein YjiS (DUF1127 family)